MNYNTPWFRIISPDKKEVSLMAKPQVYIGEPPLRIRECFNGDVQWECECGTIGISSSATWAHSDVNRHRQQKIQEWIER